MCRGVFLGKFGVWDALEEKWTPHWTFFHSWYSVKFRGRGAREKMKGKTVNGSFPRLGWRLRGLRSCEKGSTCHFPPMCPSHREATPSFGGQSLLGGGGGVITYPSAKVQPPNHPLTSPGPLLPPRRPAPLRTKGCPPPMRPAPLKLLWSSGSFQKNLWSLLPPLSQRQEEQGPARRQGRKSALAGVKRGLLRVRARHSGTSPTEVPVIRDDVFCV